eukprot:3383954-Pyramimonas_sp.AAC.2
MFRKAAQETARCPASRPWRCAPPPCPGNMSTCSRDAVAEEEKEAPGVANLSTPVLLNHSETE